MKWKTSMTQLLGCKYPVMQGAMAGYGTWKFAAAVAEAGGHGILTASVSRSPEMLREDIRKCRDATADSIGSFGVNLTMGTGVFHIEKMLEVFIEEGVPVGTSSHKPDSLASRIKESGVTWIHKVARVGDAMHAENLGVDAVIIVRLEGAGLKNTE